MKLKNKKTGEIVEINLLSITHHNNGMKSSGPFFGADSLAELCEDWEDYEEPEGWWFIDRCYEAHATNSTLRNIVADKEIGNYFETKEEAEKAVEKLKALKRLKDEGFRFDGWEDLQAKIGIDDLMLFSRDVINTDNVIGFRMDDYHDCIKDLDICFGGEE